MALFGSGIGKGISAGAVFTDVGAHVLRDTFAEAGKYMDSTTAKAAKGAHMRITGDLFKDGFERAGRQFRQTQAEAKAAAESIDKQLASVNASMDKVAEGSKASMKVVQGQLIKTRDTYRALEESAGQSAKGVEDAARREMKAVEESQRVQREQIAQTKRTMEESAAAGGGGMGGGGRKLEQAHEDAGKKAAGSWKKGFESAAKAGKWTILGFLGVGAVSVKAAADFEKQMEMIRTQAGGSQKEVEKLGKQVEKLGPAVGVGPTKLAEGLFHIESAGIRGAKAMELLGKAAELARVGGSGMEETTNALVAVLNSAPKDIHNASEAVGVMNDIVGQGNMRMKDLVGALTTGIVPAAKAVGLGFRDVGAALDTLTSRGIPAEEGATRLRTVLSLIANPTAKAEKALAQLGLQHDSLAKAFRHGGLTDGLETLQKAMDKAFPKGHALNVEETNKAIATYRHTLEESGVTGDKLGKDLEGFQRKLKDSGSAAIQQSQIIADAFGGARMGTTMQILIQNLDSVRDHTKKLSEGGAAQRFQKSWEATEKTFSEKMAKVWAGIQKIGIEVGQWLIPQLEKLGEKAVSAANWLGKHQTILHDLIYLIGTVLVTAVGAFFLKWGMSLVKTYKDFTALVKQVAGFGKSTQRATDERLAQMDAESAGIDALIAKQLEYDDLASGKGGSKPQGRGAGGGTVPGGVAKESATPQLQGVHGGPVTLNNPLPMVMEDGVQGGLGGKAAKVGVNDTSAAGGTVVPGGTAKESVGGGAATASLKEKLSSGASSLMSGLLRAGMIAGFGSIASEMVGSAIGGSKGQAASTLGQGISVGAAAGSIFGPEGMVAGGVLGGLVGGFKLFEGKAEDEGEKVGHKAAKGIEKATGDKLAKQLSEAVTKPYGDKFGKELESIQEKHGVGSRQEKLLVEKAARESERINQQAGSSFAKTTVTKQLQLDTSRGVGGPAEAITSIIDKVIPRLKDLPEQAAAAGGKTIIEMAKEMEKKGELPKRSVHEIVVALGKEFPALKSYAERAGKESMKALEASAQADQTLKSSEKFMNNLRNVFNEFPKITGLSATNARERWSEANKVLEHEEKTGDYNKRLAAKEAREQLKREEIKFYDDRTKNVHDRLITLNKEGSHRTKEGNEELQILYGVRAEIIKEKLALGVTNSQTATRELNANFIAELTALGSSPAEAKAFQKNLAGVHAGAEQIGGILRKAEKESGVPIKAGGGMASPYGGTGSDDHVLVDPHGRAVAAMSGTEGIVNRPQMSVINDSLQVTKALGITPYGSIHDLWNSGMKHYAAGGPGPKSNKTGYVFPFPKGEKFEWDRIDQGQDLKGPPGGPVLAVGPGNVSIGHDVFSGFGPFYPIENLSAGPWVGKPIYYGHAKDIKVGPVQAGDVIGVTQSRDNEWTAAPAGWLELGFTSALGHGIANQGAAIAPALHALAAGHMVAGMGGASFTPLKEPKWKGPGGLIGDIGKGVIRKATHAANVALSHIAGSQQPGANVPGGRPFGGSGGNFLATAYGPPWGGIEGGGSTATGINLTNAPHEYIIAVDPTVIPMHSRVKVWPNPFNYQGYFQAEDTGGAIKGHHIDIYDWKGRADQNAWGARNVTVSRAFGGLIPGFQTGGTPSVKQPAGRGPQGTLKIGHPKRNPNIRIRDRLHPTSQTRKQRAGRTQRPARRHSAVAHGKGAPHHQNYTPHHGVKHTKVFVEGEGYTGLPKNVIAANEAIEAQQHEIQQLDTAYQNLGEEYNIPPLPEPLVTLTDADVAVMDPAGFTNAKGEYIPGPTGLIPGDQIVNPAGMIAGRFFGPRGVEGGNAIPGIDTRKAQIGNLLGILGAQSGAYTAEQTKDEFLVGGPTLTKAGVPTFKGGQEKKEIKNREERIKVYERKSRDRKHRKERIETFKRKNEQRINALKERIANITTGNVQANLAKALGKGETLRRKHDIEMAKQELSREREAEKKYQKSLIEPKEKDPSYENVLKAQEHTLAEALSDENYIAGQSSAAVGVQKAHDAVLRNSLQRQVVSLTGGDKEYSREIKEDEIKIKEYRTNMKTLAKQIETLQADETPHQEDIKSLGPLRHALSNDIDTLNREDFGLAHAANIQPRPQKNVQKENEEVAKQAIADLSALDAASQALFQQFGSNTLSSAQLGAALTGGISRGGVRYFGAAGGTSAANFGPPAFAGGGVPAPSSGGGSTEHRNFYQTNHYSVGPQHPHIHAQESAAEFAARMG